MSQIIVKETRVHNVRHVVPVEGTILPLGVHQQVAKMEQIEFKCT